MLTSQGKVRIRKNSFTFLNLEFRKKYATCIAEVVDGKRRFFLLELSDELVKHQNQNLSLTFE
jgi:hypothetical protein